MLKCDMCHKPLKEKRFQITVFLRPELTMTVGPECYRKTKKAEKALREQKSPEEIFALRAKIASLHAV